MKIEEALKRGRNISHSHVFDGSIPDVGAWIETTTMMGFALIHFIDSPSTTETEAEHRKMATALQELLEKRPTTADFRQFYLKVAKSQIGDVGHPSKPG